MIFVDANVLLSMLTTPVTPQDEEMKARATALLAKVADGSIRATTNDVVFHEVCWILGAKSRYGVHPSEIINIMRSVLTWAGWAFPPGDLQIYYRALDIFGRDPKLEFSDSIIAARAEAMGAELATFDTRLAKAYDGPTWA